MSALTADILLSALLSWAVAEWAHHRAEVLRLVQAPNHRSSHTQPTPNGGGVGIMVAGSLAGIVLVLFFGWMLGWFVLGIAGCGEFARRYSASSCPCAIRRAGGGLCGVADGAG